MAENDFQYGGWNSYTVQCGTIMTLISPGDCTLQCGRWLWDDMQLNSPKRPPYWNSTSGFDFDHITTVIIIIVIIFNEKLTKRNSLQYEGKNKFLKKFM